MKHWTLTTLREKLIKIGAKVVPCTVRDLPDGGGGGAAGVVRGPYWKGLEGLKLPAPLAAVGPPGGSDVIRVERELEAGFAPHSN